MGKKGCCSPSKEPHYILISLALLLHLNEYEENCSSGCPKGGTKAALQPLLEKLLELFKRQREGKLNIRDRGRTTQINPKRIQTYGSEVKAWSMI